MEKLIVEIGIILLFILGALIYYKSFQYAVTKQYRFSSNISRQRFQGVIDFLNKELANEKTEEFVKQAGLNISGLLYQFIRYSVLILLLAYIAYSNFILHHGVRAQVILWVIIFFISRPIPKIYNYDSPFLVVCSFFKKREKIKFSKEIDRCISHLKNMTISIDSDQTEMFSSDYIIKELSKYTKHTRPFFLKLLGYWYEGRYQEGQEYFYISVGTEEARSLAALFAKLDYLPPQEFVLLLEHLQNESKERRKTYSQNSKKIQSDILFGVALTSGILILLNFFAVVVGIDVVKTLQNINF